MELHQHFLLLLSLLIASCGYCYFLISLLPKGITRLIFLLPVFYLLSIFPWIFSSSMTLRLLSSFLLTWITSFKLILFCFNQGPLVNATTNLLDFALITIFPIKLRGTLEHGHMINCVDTSNGLVTIGIWSLSIGTLGVWFISTLPTKTYFSPHNWFHPLFTIVVILASVDILASVVARYEMIQLVDHTDRTTSLQDFWGRRWNRLASDMLRQTVHNPVRHTLTGLTGVSPIMARVLALIVTLIISGLMHELMFYYITCGARPTWEVTSFFALHGVCMVIESGLSMCSTRWQSVRVRPSIATWLTLGFVTATGYWLILLPALRKGEGECRLKGLVFF